MAYFDKVLISGNFNINVCCPDKALVSEFLSIIDCLKLGSGCLGPRMNKNTLWT